jgi:hypothetical protein
VGFEAPVALQPRSDLWMLMDGVVVLDYMDVEVFGRFAINLL